MENNGYVYIFVRERIRKTQGDKETSTERGRNREVSDECNFTLFGYIKNKIKPKGH